MGRVFDGGESGEGQAVLTEMKWAFLEVGGTDERVMNVMGEGMGDWWSMDGTQGGGKGSVGRDQRGVMKGLLPTFLFRTFSFWR